MYIDFHSHMDFYKPEKMKEAIREINNNNIKVLACAMDEESYKSNLEISKLSKNIIPTFGIHPSKIINKEYDFDMIEEYIKNSPLVGEVGLDFFWVDDKTTYDKQIEVFNYFLKKSKEYNKYINIHTKGAEELVYKMIRDYDVTELSIIHWYSGNLQTLDELIDSKCYFTASIDLKYSELARQILNKVPINSLLAETDGPTALEWVNGEYAMPTEIINVYKNICEIKNIDINEFIDISEQSCCKILNNE